MGQEFCLKCPIESRRLLLLIGLSFAMVFTFQYFELPYGGVLSSLFSGGKAQVPDLSLKPKEVLFNNINSTTSNIAQNELVNITQIPKGVDLDEGNDFVSDRNGDSDDVSEFDEDANPRNHSLSENFDLKTNLTVEKSTKNDQFGDLDLKNNQTVENSTSEERLITANSDPTTSFSSSDPTTSFSLPPISSPPHISSENTDTNMSTKPISFSTNASSIVQDSTSSLHRNEEHLQHQNVAAVVSLSEMNKMLLQSQASSQSMKPLWSSPVDQELLNIKSQIVGSWVRRKTPGLYAALYQNVSMFRRSYELMEQKLKVYIYREGEKPVFHTPVLKGIYASEGWFMKILQANKQYVTKNPKNAHLFYLPFSSRMLEETLYVPDSHSDNNLRQYLKKYLDMIIAKYPFWNRTAGADHFLVACHDWAPSETRQLMANCIRALCNTDLKEGFKFGKDVSLPETKIQKPQNLLQNLGGNPSSDRPVLAFFAGKMHGYLRPILLQQWQNKDPDMKIFGRLPKSKSNRDYIRYMKSSKFCICAKGFEVNSPRVVEAIFYECVPVIISDNFVPPFFEVLNWKSFAVFVKERDIPNLKNILLSISEKKYVLMQQRVKQVQQHFLWHGKPVKYDIFNMILHSIWYNRVFQASTM